MLKQSRSEPFKEPAESGRAIRATGDLKLLCQALTASQPAVRTLILAGLITMAIVHGRTTCASPESDSQASAESAGQYWALIIVGLPGDDEHRRLFGDMAETWKHALERAGFEAANVWLLSERGENLVTRETIDAKFTELSGRIQPDDSLWVFWLGHANHGDGRSAFHVRGPDVDDTDMARWLDRVSCRQQVVWLTHASSGWFLKRLSAPQRILICATAADHEPNETEFPLALAEVLKDFENLDADADHRISVLELFTAASTLTESRYRSTQRIPTEHAQLDDNGDARGTELPNLADKRDLDLPPEQLAAQKAAAAPRDGNDARQVLLPVVLEPRDAQPINSDE